MPTLRHVWSTALVAAVLLAATPALGHDVDGRFGIGYEETLTGVQGLDTSSVATPNIHAGGLSAIYHVGDWGLELITAGSVQVGASGDVPWTVFGSMGAHYNVFRAPFVNLSVGVRALGGLARLVGDAGARPLRVGSSVEAPLRVTFFSSPIFAISASVGPVIDILWGGGTNPLTGQTGSLNVWLFRGGFSGGLGFTCYIL